MFKHLNGDKWLGLMTVIAALGLIFVWVPLDIDTGLVETVRRQTTLGDSLGPVIAGAVILLGGIMTWLQPNADSPRLTTANLQWLAKLFLAVAVSMILMRYVGPTLVDMVVDPPYRALRATPPWNYVGYFLGGTFLVCALVALIRGKLGVGVFLVAVIATLAIALLYDLPFDDLQLPPNGDV